MGHKARERHPEVLSERILYRKNTCNKVSGESSELLQISIESVRAVYLKRS